MTRRFAALLGTIAIVAMACGSASTPSAAPESAAPATPAPATAAPATEAPASEAPSTPAEPASACAGAQESEFYNKADCERQLAQRSMTPEGDAAMPWLQMIEPVMFDTAKFKKEPPYKVCFSNAGVNNPWRVVGFTTMEAEVDAQKKAGLIKEFVHVDAGGQDNKQISDMTDLLTQGCDVLIVAPNTTAALTPAVEAACASEIPIIVFDRGVTTKCPVTFIHPIGGYAYGATAAEFLAEKVPAGGKILALRILPGVDVLETRWSGAKALFEQKGLDVIGEEFTDGDPAKTKSIVSDYLQRGAIDGVWMDAGATSVGAIEAFEDAGLPVPPITGEDQNDFLAKWSDGKLTAIAPTYPTFQWRTPILAAMDILAGKPVPEEWVLPQPTVDESNLAQFYKPEMPPLYYAMSSAETMEDFPERWQK
jgi:ribose transport system substrate-binding protein